MCQCVNTQMFTGAPVLKLSSLYREKVNPRGRAASHASIVTLGRVGALGLALARELGESWLGIGYTYTLGPAKGAPDITRHRAQSQARPGAPIFSSVQGALPDNSLNCDVWCYRNSNITYLISHILTFWQHGLTQLASSLHNISTTNTMLGVLCLPANQN